MEDYSVQVDEIYNTESKINNDSDEDIVSDSIIVYEYKIDGMTCVACSSAIENGLKHEFKEKGLLCDNGSYQVSVVLLMHKMKISF